MRFPARFILAFVLFTIYYLLFTIPTYAQSSPYTVPNTNPDVPKNLHTWTQNVMIEVMSAMSCQLSGIDPTNPNGKCLGVDSKTGKIGFVENGGGAIGVAGHMIGMLYTPPLHTGDYFKYLAGNFGIAKPANAASGFEGLKPIQKVWVAFRNVVYLLFVIVFVVIGLAIMLRVKIDPRTVMTIQNQIPKIIVGLLLVTFSFAIAGFLIDLMYVVIFLSYEIIASANITDVSKLNPLVLQDKTAIGAVTSGSILGGGVFGIANNIALILRETIAGFIALSTLPLALANLFDLSGLKLDPVGNPAYSITDFLVDFTSIGVAWRFAAQAAAIIGNHSIFGVTIPISTAGGIATGLGIFALVEGFLRFAIPYLIVFLIVMIALFFALFRIWFTLILAYIGILLDVVFAPFWIVAGLFPGSPIGFSAWLRNIVANLAAFPAVIIMFLLAKIFTDGFGASRSDTDFVPPLIGALPGTDVLGNIIGLGILLMTPGIAAMIKSALKAPGVPAGGPIGAAIGVGGGVLTGPAGALKQGFALSFGQAAAARFGLAGGGAPKKVKPNPGGP